ncbi:AzlD domain-containing protein [Propionibacteriaceae bacterium Y1923]|uniref:AzlD domain-containing protein n=1 Tax=Aestuariimicrobium sp. Y1814 TaxID=3418742 RepID=UPI003C1547D1
MTWWILLACLIAFATKFAGYLLPESVLENPTMVAVTSATTIGLLGALIATNAVTRGQALVLDSRLLAVVVALVALRLKAPFIVVVVLGAASVAIGRAVGLP